MIPIDDYKKIKECVYKDEQYSARDNEPVMRHQRDGMRKRKLDDVWSFGTPNFATSYMKKLALLIASIFMMAGCEKEVIGEGYPEMEAFYAESCGLPIVTVDSVRLFSSKVDNYTDTYPESKEHSLYPRIQENIQAASLRITITCDTTWAGFLHLHF